MMYLLLTQKKWQAQLVVKHKLPKYLTDATIVFLFPHLKSDYTQNKSTYIVLHTRVRQMQALDAYYKVILHISRILPSRKRTTDDNHHKHTNTESPATPPRRTQNKTTKLVLTLSWLPASGECIVSITNRNLSFMYKGFCKCQKW